jgi:hypothetical protein
MNITQELAEQRASAGRAAGRNQTYCITIVKWFTVWRQPHRAPQPTTLYQNRQVVLSNFG